MPNLGEDKAADIIGVFERLSGKRGTWESHWQEIADRIYPNAREGFVAQQFEKGDKKTELVYDSTASIALNRFAAILDSLLTPRNQRWHRIVPANKDLFKDRSARLWYEDVTDVLFKQRYAPRANFASQNQLNYKSLGAFGTGALYIDQLVDRTGTGLRYKNCHLGQMYFMENHQGIIDVALRHFEMTARQAVDKFGDKVPPAIKTAMNTDETKEFWFIHYVAPNENIDPGRADFRGMEYSSIYVAIEGKKVVEEGGYNTFPYTPSRYEQAMGEVYGRSPAMEVLPAIKTLNEQKKTLLKQGHRAVDPVLLVHDDGVLDTFSLAPGALNAGGVSKDGRPLVHTLPTGSVAAGKDMMDDERQVINDNFLVNIFQILIDTPQMTATEVLERTREKSILLAPTIGRQESERLGPQIEREIDVLSSLNLLPPMPPIIEEAGTSFEVEYDSPLSRTQKAEEASGLMRTLESILNYVNVTGDTAPLDHFNFDVITPELSDINAVPVKWRNGKDTISNKRQQRQKAAQEQKAMESAPSMASIAKTVSGGK